MKLPRDTSMATLIQFIVLGLLNIGNAVNSIVSTCRHDGSDCVSNVLTSFIYYILLAVWFGFLAALGYMVQDRRSRRLAFVLFGAEGLTALIAYFNAKHHNDLIGLVTSLLDVLFAIWIMTLAYRVWHSRGQRITTSTRTRRRVRNSPDN